MTQTYSDGSRHDEDRGISGNLARIDMGPFLRQEGRIPSRKPPSSEMALRIKLGLSNNGVIRQHVSAARRASQATLQRLPRLMVWTSWLVHMVRRPS